MNDIKHDQLLRELAQKTCEGIMTQREEILAAFVAKYGYGPDEAMQVQQRTETGTRWWVERRLPGIAQQLYAYHPEEGVELFSTAREAKEQAELWLADDQAGASSDGWHEDQGSLEWGYLVPVESAQVVERHPAPDDGGFFDEFVRYGLRPVRFGNGEAGE